VAKWRKRTDTTDAAMGPKEVRSTVLTPEQQAVIVTFRKLTLLALDDCLYALQPSIPCLTRSSLHRCLQCHGISRLVDTTGEKLQKKRFKSYPIGYFHIDIAEVQTEQGRLYLFVGIDRTSKYAYAELHEKATRMTARDFLTGLITAVPYTSTQSSPITAFSSPSARALRRIGTFPSTGSARRMVSSTALLKAATLGPTARSSA
jgi:hypothetical protein